MNTAEGTSVCSHEKTNFLICTNKYISRCDRCPYPQTSFAAWEISLSQERIWGKLWQLTCRQLWVELPAPSLAEPKSFSKSSMKSAPLAQQREANEANGRILDAWYWKIRLNYVTFTPSYSHPLNILVPCRHWLISPLSTRHWQSQTSTAISLLHALIRSLWSTSFTFHPWMFRH